MVNVLGRFFFITDCIHQVLQVLCLLLNFSNLEKILLGDPSLVYIWINIINGFYISHCKGNEHNYHPVIHRPKKGCQSTCPKLEVNQNLHTESPSPWNSRAIQIAHWGNPRITQPWKNSTGLPRTWSQPLYSRETQREQRKAQGTGYLRIN